MGYTGFHFKSVLLKVGGSQTMCHSSYKWLCEFIATPQDASGFFWLFWMLPSCIIQDGRAWEVEEKATMKDCNKFANSFCKWSTIQYYVLGKWRAWSYSFGCNISTWGAQTSGCFNGVDVTVCAALTHTKWIRKLLCVRTIMSVWKKIIDWGITVHKIMSRQFGTIPL